MTANAIAALTVQVVISKDYLSHDVEVRLVDAARSNDISTVRKLLRKLANPNIHDLFGNTPLVSASEAGNSEIVRLLLEYGADVNHPSTCGVTPLHAAVKGNHIEIIHRLILAGANLKKETFSHLKPKDKTEYNNKAWESVRSAELGDLPDEVVVANDLFDIPTYSIPPVESLSDTKAKGKKGRKKKGKKRRKKKGKKK